MPDNFRVFCSGWYFMKFFYFFQMKIKKKIAPRTRGNQLFNFLQINKHLYAWALARITAARALPASI